MGTKPAYVTYSVAAWIVAYKVAHGGNAPVYSEMAEHFTKPLATVQHLLERLYDYGVAERLDGKLCIVGENYVPPQWYIDGLNPSKAKTHQYENSRRNKLPDLKNK